MGRRVSVRYTFECGRCGNIVRRVIESTEDGLFPIPHYACGRCVGKNHLTQMSMTMSDERVLDEKADTATQQVSAAASQAESLELAGVKRHETTDTRAKVQGLQRYDGVPEARPTPAPASESSGGRKSTDAPDGKDPVAREGSSCSVPPMAKRPPLSGKQA